MATYRCPDCPWIGHTFNSLIEHGQSKHGEKVIDPGNEFSSPNAKKLAGVIEWVRRQPDANLKTGEGKLLVDEIDRLQAEVTRLNNNLFESHRSRVSDEIGR